MNLDIEQQLVEVDAAYIGEENRKMRDRVFRCYFAALQNAALELKKQRLAGSATLHRSGLRDATEYKRGFLSSVETEF